MNHASGTTQTEQWLLAIETSCDETACALIREDLFVAANVVASQANLHERFGGVVPEIASRAHLERLLPVADAALKQAGLTLDRVAAVAVVTEPGLVGSLLVGLTCAKTLSLALDVPLVAVNHLEAHLYACRMAAGDDVFPAVGLVVSGGHTNFYDCAGPTSFTLMGSTIDDAAGEAFDKAARILELPYPGGPSIEKAARTGNPAAFSFPRPMIDDQSLDMSFSGLKTAVLYEARGQPGARTQPPPLTSARVADFAASFQEAVVDVLVTKCRRALADRNRNTLCVGGGVAANSRLRQRLTELAERQGVRLVIAPRDYCTDNAAMAGIAWELLRQGKTTPLTCDVSAGVVRRSGR